MYSVACFEEKLVTTSYTVLILFNQYRFVFSFFLWKMNNTSQKMILAGKQTKTNVFTTSTPDNDKISVSLAFCSSFFLHARPSNLLPVFHSYTHTNISIYCTRFSLIFLDVGKIAAQTF